MIVGMANDDVFKLNIGETVMQNVDGDIMKTLRPLHIQRYHCYLIDVLHQIMTLIYAN